MMSSLHSAGRYDRSRRASFSLVLAFCFLILGALAPRVEAQTVVRGPYLQSGTPSSIIVRWRTDIPTDSLVRFGTTQGSLSQMASGSLSTTEHVVSIEGLAVDTKYYYSVGTLSAELAGNDNEHFFVTSPIAGEPKPTRIWVIGDSGTANANAMAVRNAFADFTGNRAPDLWLMLGDNAYSDGTDAQYQAAVFDMYPGILRHTVLWPTLGNHDGHTASSASQSGPYYDIFTLPTGGSAGGVPSGTEAYYSFDYGNIHIICLNSTDVDRSPSGSMLTWLTMDLQNNDKPWVIAFWHHPPYSKGSHDSDSSGTLSAMRENALPILEDYGVDLVLSGHSHSYERSYLIDSHYGTSNTFVEAMKKDPGDGSELGDGAYQKPFLPGASHEGAVYAVAGSSGKTSGGSLDHPVMVVSLNNLGSMVLDIDGPRLDARFLDHNVPANVLDDFTILKGPDTNAPVITSVQAATANEVIVTYGERVEETSATTVTNYTIDNSVDVTNATLSADGVTVTLTTTPLAQGSYILTVNNVTDLAANLIAVDTQITFEYLDTSTVAFQDGVLPNSGYFGTADTYLSENQPTSNFGFATSLSIDGDETQQKDTYALLKWDISTIPSGSVVTAAEIVIYVTGSSSGPYELYELKRAGVEDEATWNQAATGSLWEIPGAQGTTDRGTAVLGTITGASGGSPYTIALNADGLALVQSWINTPASNNGVIIANTNTADGLDISSREAGTPTNRPLLRVTYTSGDTEPPTPPGGLTVTSVSTSEVGLTWTASTDNTGVVEYRIYKDGLQTGTATGTSFTVTALAPNTTYDFWVTARDLAGNESGASNTVTATTDPDTEAPTAPGTPTLVAKSDTAVTITWSWATDNVGVVAYDVYRDGAQVGSTTQTENTFTDTVLTASTTYGYSLTARDAAGNVSVQSGTLTVTTDAGPDTEAPTAPGTPTLVAKDDTTVTIAWGLATDNVGVVAYDVYRDGVAVGSTTEPDNIYTDTGLSPETPYGYSVIAQDAAGNVSAFSGTLTVTTDPSPQPLVHVSGITLTLRSFGQWYAARAVVTVADGSGSPVDGATVAVQWSGLTAGTASAVTTGGSVTFDSEKVPNSSTGQFVLTVTGVSAPGYTYDPSANVQSDACIDTTGSSCSVGPPPPPDTAPPAAPTSLVATAGAGSVALDWGDNNTDADWASFSVYRSTTAGSGHVLIAEGVTASQYMDTGLSGGTTYYYFITAKDTSGNESAPSNEASATPADPPQLSVHVIGVDVVLLQQGKNYTGVASVTVVDQDGSPLAGVSVEGTWTLSETPIGSGSGTTDASGQASIDSSKQKPSTGQIFRFTVTNLIRDGYTYDAASNTTDFDDYTVP